MELRSLVEDDDRQGFSCGDAQLDDFFRARAGQNQFKHRASATYVLVDACAIAAFVTVVPGTARRDDLGPAFQRMPPSPLPVLVLARMGVSTAHQRKGHGERLLAKVLSLALGLSRDVGCVGVLVDAKLAARGFYERFDFSWLPDQSRADLVRGFLSIRTIEAASQSASDA